jgi:hypothetical protein
VLHIHPGNSEGIFGKPLPKDEYADILHIHLPCFQPGSARKFFGGERWNSHRHNGSIMAISRPRPVRASPRRAQPPSGIIGTILAPALLAGSGGSVSEAPLAVLHIHPGNSDKKLGTQIKH